MAATSSGSAVLTLTGDDAITITREFDAPRHLVYRALTTPDLVRRWWTARRGEVTECEIDLRVGGSWRWVLRTEDGAEVAFHGTYRELVPDERLVYTEAFEGVPDADASATVNTVTLEEDDGRTAMTLHVQAPSPEVRDAILESGMEAGMQDAYDLLEEVAVSLR